MTSSIVNLRLSTISTLQTLPGNNSSNEGEFPPTFRLQPCLIAPKTILQ
jgi:hypothetical protein